MTLKEGNRIDKKKRQIGTNPQGTILHVHIPLKVLVSLPSILPLSLTPLKAK